MDAKAPTPDDEPTELNVILEPMPTGRTYRLGLVKVRPGVDPAVEQRLREVLTAAHSVTSILVADADDVTPFTVEARTGPV